MLSNPRIAARLPKSVLWFFGMGGTSGSIASVRGHMFAQDHIRNGIMKLGASQRNIFDKVFRLVSNKITKAANGSNQMYRRVNGYDITIRFYFKDGQISNLNAFMGKVLELLVT